MVLLSLHGIFHNLTRTKASKQLWELCEAVSATQRLVSLSTYFHCGDGGGGELLSKLEGIIVGCNIWSSHIFHPSQPIRSSLSHVSFLLPSPHVFDASKEFLVRNALQS